MYQTIAILYIRIKFKLSLPSRTEWYVTGVYDLFFVSIKTTRVVHQQINLRATYQVTAKSRNLLSQAGQPLHRKQTSRQTPPPNGSRDYSSSSSSSSICEPAGGRRGPFVSRREQRGSEEGCVFSGPWPHPDLAVFGEGDNAEKRTFFAFRWTGQRQAEGEART